MIYYDNSSIKKVEYTKGVIRNQTVNSIRTENTMATKGQKDKQRSLKHYTEN